MMLNPYHITGPATVSVSGGRSSGYMLWHILNAHDGKLPDNVIPVFANTGKEMPQTLDFLHDMERHWGVKVLWVEGSFSAKPYKAITKEVNYETASRDGRPFRELIEAKRYLPNRMARICTVEMKIKRIDDAATMCGLTGRRTEVLGMRADEPRRLRNPCGFEHTRKYPMAAAGVTRQTVHDWWANQPFNLNLPLLPDGSAPLGNCDFCFLKGIRKRVQIAQSNPELTHWWRERERETSQYRRDKGLKRDVYFENEWPVDRIIARASDERKQMELLDNSDIDCYCGD